MSKIFSAFKAISKIFGGGGGGLNWVFAVLSLIGLFTKKKKTVSEINNKNNDSPVYGWEGVTTTADTDIPVPLIFGKHQVGGNIVNTYIASNIIENIQNEAIVLTATTSADDITNKRMSYVTPSINSAVCRKIQFTLRNATAQFNPNTGLGSGSNNGSEEYDDINIFYKKTADSTWRMLTTIKGDTLRVSPATSVTMWTDSNYNGTYDIRMEHVGITRTLAGSNGIIRKQVVTAYNKIVIDANAFKYTSYFVGTNASSSQTLYLDVALGVGQLENVTNIQVNDQYISDYIREGDIDKKSLSITHEFKAGHDLLVPFNKNDFITVQSSVFNKNASITRNCRTQFTESTVIGSPTVHIAQASAIFGTSGARSELRYKDSSGNWHTYYISDIVNETVTLTANMTQAVSAGTDVYAPDETSPDKHSGWDYTVTGEFTNFTYVTQGDYTDRLDIGLNTPNGLYTIDNDGNYQKGTAKYKIWVAHYTQQSDLDNIETTNLLAEEVTIIGSRTGRIWYNKVLDESVLVLKEDTKKKRYCVKVKKLSRDTYESTAKNDMQIAYVEEIKNKDIYYNNVGYVSLIMPADSKLNGGTPSFKFEVEGLLVPCVLPPSIIINQANSNASVIELKNTNTVNYNEGGTDYKLNALAFKDGDKIVDLGNWSSILTNASIVQTKKSGSSFYKGKNVITAYFKCTDGKWYKKYCILKTNRSDYDTYGDMGHASQIQLLTAANIAALKTEYASSPDMVELFNEISYIYTETELPSTPIDVMLYKWSDNHAEGLLYMLLNEDNGLGLPGVQVDLDSFKEAKSYFDEFIEDPLNKGKYIKRYQLNLVLDTVANAREHIDKICATCHSSLYETNGVIKIVVDKKASAVLPTINEESHILPDTLKVISLPPKELPNQINLTYLNKDNNYAREPITVEDPKLSRSIGYGKLRRMEMDVKGTTDESHVYLEGIHLIKSARYINFSIVFKTVLAGLGLEIGDVFRLESTTLGFGVQLEDGSFQTNSGKRFKVSSVKRGENSETEISALEYFDEIYDISAEDLITYNTVRHTSLPNLSQRPVAVRNLTLREENFRNISGDIALNIVGYFNPPNVSALVPLNRMAFLSQAATAGQNMLYLKGIDTYKQFKPGDKITLNTELNESGTTPTTYTVTSLSVDNTMSVTPNLTENYAADSYISKYEYSMNKYEYGKFSYALIDIYKDGVILKKGLKSDGDSFKYANVGTGTYVCVVHSVSANDVIGDSVSASITITGKQMAPASVLSGSVTQFKYKNNYKIAWESTADKDIRHYVVTITPDFTTPEVAVVTKTVIYPLECEHTFSVSGTYNVTIEAVNTTGIVSNALTLPVNVVVELTEAFAPKYTLRGNLIIVSWNGIEAFNETVKYEAYMKAGTPFVTDGGDWNPVTHPYLGLTSELRAWEGTSTQIPIGNLPNGSILTYDTDYYIVVVAKYKFNGVETTRQSEQIHVNSLSESKPIIVLYGITPDLADGGLLESNHFEAFVAAVPDSGVTAVYGTLSKPDGTSINASFTKNQQSLLWEYEFTNLADGTYNLQIYGNTVYNNTTNPINVQIKVDTSIPDALPQPYITKDNTYVQTQAIAYSAQTTTPFKGGDTIDIFNSKTIQVCLPTFTTCSNFSHIKMYIAEYNNTTKTWGAYTEYKIPQPVLQSGEVVVNFKSTVTFAEDMPDFKIKMVQVKKTGAEGHIAYAIASTRSKIDTTPPLIKLNAINYEGDSTNYNAVANKFINGRVNAGLGLLLDLSVTETNSGLWSNAIDIATLKMPVYYQIDGGEKKPLYNVDGRVATPYLIPKADFAGIAENTKVTITVYALDNALKVGTYTFTKILDTVAPGDVTDVKTVFGVEANKGVIKASWTKPTATDFSGVRVYDGSTVIAEVTNNNISIAITDGSDKTLKFVAFDEANNEASGVTVTAKNYPPKAPVMIGATSNSGAVSVEWNQVTEDTNNDVMTDLAYYEISYYNPRTSTTTTAKTTNNIFEIKMSKEDNAYFNSHLNDYITAIKVRAVDFFGGVNGTGAYSTPELQARPRFIEAVDMEGNIFKFVPSTDATPTLHGDVTSLDCIVDANYKNTDYVELSGITQGKYLRITMSPTYVAETKVKFVNTSGSTIAARFVLHYRVINPVTLAESDIYIQATSHSINEITADAVLDYGKYIEVSLASSSDDNSNTFAISLLKDNLSRTNFYIKYAELLFTGYNSTLNISEMQPKTRSIANDFYGETLLLSNMISIRSTKDVNTFMEIYKDGLGITYSGNKVTTIGKLSDGSYGAWFKDKVFIGGTSIADAPIRIDTNPSISMGGFVANTSYSYISGSEGAFSSNGGLNTNCLKGNSTSATVGYSDNSKITATASLTEVKQVNDVGWSQYTQDYLAFGVGTYGNSLKAKFGKLATSLYGIWMTDGVYIGGATYATAAMRLTSGANGTIEMGYNAGDYKAKINSDGAYFGKIAGQNFYNTQITSSDINLGYFNNLYSVIINQYYTLLRDTADNAKQIMISANTTVKLYGIGIGYRWYTNSMYYFDTIIQSGCTYMGLNSYDAYYGMSYNMQITGNSIKLGKHYSYNGSGFFDTLIEGGSIKLGIVTYDASMNAYYNTIITASDYKTGLVSWNTGYYNTVITSGKISLGHLSSGTTYALTMDFSSSESTSMGYVAIRGADYAEYFRVGYYTTTSASSFRGVWAKQIFIKSDYSSPNDACRTSSLFIQRNSTLINGLTVYGSESSGVGIYSNSTYTPAISGVSSSSNGVEGESTSGYGVKGVSNSNYGVYGESSSGVGVRAYSASNHGIYATTGSSSVFAAYFVGTFGLGVNGRVRFFNILSSGTAGIPLHIDANGDVFTYTGSSERYKDNMVERPYNRAILDLPVMNFTWKDSGNKGFGSWAEKVHEIYPELVSYDKQGRPDSVKYFEMPILLLQVCKEQQKELDILKVEIATLKNLVDSLVK